MADDDIWYLPGPRRWLGRLTDVARRHAFGVVVVPENLGRRWIRPAFLAASHDLSWPDARRTVYLAELASDVRDPASALAGVAELLGLRPTPSDPGGFLRAAGNAGLLAWVESRSAPAAVREHWIEALRYLASASTGQAGHCSVLTEIHGPVAASDLALSQHHWRGVLGRLDTMLYVEELALNLGDDGACRPERMGMIAELAMFDLELADLLMDARWEGSLDDLGDLLDTRWEQRECELDGLRRPAPEVGWQAGVFDTWRGVGERYAIDLPCQRAAVKGVLWSAQVRELFPLLEELRYEIVHVASLEHKDLFLQELGDQPFEAEINTLYGARSRLLTREKALVWLHRTRNRLAHHELVAPGDGPAGRSHLEDVQQRLARLTSVIG